MKRPRFRVYRDGFPPFDWFWFRPDPSNEDWPLLGTLAHGPHRYRWTARLSAWIHTRRG